MTMKIRGKVGLLELAKQLGNVSQACKVMGYSRDSFYRFRDLYEQGGEMALAEMTKRRPNLKNRVAPEVEEAVVAIAVEQPAWGQTRASNELKRRGIEVSPFGVRSIWIRHDLRTMKDRLKALEAKVAQEGGVLTESQLAAREGQGRQRGPRRVRERASGLLRRPGHLLRRHAQGCRPRVSADGDRHLLEGRLRQAL